MFVAFSELKKMGFPSKILSLVLVNVVLTSIFAPSLTYALEAKNPNHYSLTDYITTADVVRALEQTNALLVEPEHTVSDVDSSAENHLVDIPMKPNKNVTIKNGNNVLASLTIPQSATVGYGTTIGDGTVAYPGKNGWANVVRATKNGVQMITVISKPNAPTRYDYGIKIPNGSYIVLANDGGALVIDMAMNITMSIPKPWAKDSRGKAIPTHFETDGKTLTQIVEHRSVNTIYPVTADPIVIWLMGAMAKCFIGGSYELYNTKHEPRWVRIWGVTWGCLAF